MLVSGLRILMISTCGIDVENNVLWKVRLLVVFSNGVVPSRYFALGRIQPPLKFPWYEISSLDDLEIT